MIIYKRNIDRKLKLVRLLSIAMVLLSAYLLWSANVFGYLVIILAIPFCLFDITGLIIRKGSIELERFYALGWISTQRSVKAADFEEKISVLSHLEHNQASINSGELIDLLGCLYIFNDSRLFKLTIKYQKRNGEWNRDIIQLNQKEFELINTLIYKLKSNSEF